MFCTFEESKKRSSSNTFLWFTALVAFAGFTFVFCYHFYSRGIIDRQIRRLNLIRYNLCCLLQVSLNSKSIVTLYNNDVYRWPWIFVMEDSDDSHMELTLVSNNSWRSNQALEDGLDDFKENVYNKEIAWNRNPNITCHNPCYCWTEDPNSPEYSMTNGMTLVGKDTITDALRSKTFPTDVKEIDKILDLIVYVEVNHSGVHWMQPGDLDVENVPEDFTKGMTGLGVAIMFLDGDIWFIDRKCPLENIKTFMTLTGARENDRDALLKPYCLRTWADVFR